jgi:multiple sugar transport system substrate-binding protein
LFDEQLQLFLEGDITIDEMLNASQEAWVAQF